MPEPTTSRWRSLRAGVFALVAVQISIAGHVLAGGMLPDLSLVVAMSALLVACLSGLSRKRRTFVVLLPAMLITQLVFHLILSVADDRHAMPGVDDHPVRMLVFHGLAAVLSAGLLGHGEAILFRLFGWLHRLIPQVQPPAAVADSAWTAVVDRAGAPLRNRLVGTARSLRGPPGRQVFAS